MDGAQLRTVLLQVVEELSQHSDGGNLQTNAILSEAAKRLGIRRGQGVEHEQSVLTFFYDLFRSGYLSWGFNLMNPEAPFCHVTALGRQALAHHSRDPANPDGYLAHLAATARISDVAQSYVSEALQTFNAGCVKATAVLIGAAAEGVVLDVRDALVTRLGALNQQVPRDLMDRRIKRVHDAIQRLLIANGAMPRRLFERFEANWAAFAAQIRRARNDAGHPVTVEPVTANQVHASLLMFPELAALATELKAWIAKDLR